ncbi:MAG: VWA domain-containing protein [Bradymonadaceae bacterium]
MAALLFPACTDADLRAIPQRTRDRADELEISGSLCTRKPERLVFPLRVLFVVDTSVSMRVTDPPDPTTGTTGRERAVRATWKRLLGGESSGVKVGIVRFASEAQSKTPVDTDGDDVPDTYFTDEKKRLNAATRALRTTQKTTNYVNALSEAHFEIRTELARSELEARPRSKYAVVFLSDGVPDTLSGGGRRARREKILAAIRSLRDLATSFGVGKFSFHTAFLATGRGEFDQRARDLLREMARTGGGEFRSFATGRDLNFVFADLSALRRTFTLKTLSAVNVNAALDPRQLPGAGRAPGLGYDAGLGDGGSAEVGSTDGGPLDASTDAVRADVPSPAEVSTERSPAAVTGAAPSESTFVDLDGDRRIGCGEPMVDTDVDGLGDLTERRIGSRPTAPDTDGDGLRDALEWRLADSGLDPLAANDTACRRGSACRDGGSCQWPDRDGDGLRDCEEVFYGTDQNGVDTDADGLPDPSEVHFSTNPAVRDVHDNLDSDKADNRTEVLANTSPRCDDAAVRSRAAYRYDIDERGLQGSKTCYDVGIENITLVPTIDRGTERFPGNGWNRILIYAGEVAFDDPSSFAAYRVACTMASYNPDGELKNPPSGRVQLSEEDFVSIREFEPTEDCNWPN